MSPSFQSLAILWNVPFLFLFWKGTLWNIHKICDFESAELQNSLCVVNWIFFEPQLNMAKRWAVLQNSIAENAQTVSSQTQLSLKIKLNWSAQFVAVLTNLSFKTPNFTRLKVGKRPQRSVLILKCDCASPVSFKQTRKWILGSCESWNKELIVPR